MLVEADGSANNPRHRLKEKGDVMELFHARRLPHELNVADPIRQHYLETWDALQA